MRHSEVPADLETTLCVHRLIVLMDLTDCGPERSTNIPIIEN